MVHLTLMCSFLCSFISLDSIKLNINNFKSKKINSKYLLISFLILFVFAAFRENYGNDYEPYLNIFNDAKNGINSANIEILFFLINSWFPSFHILLACLSFFYLKVAHKLIIDNVDKRYYWLACLIFLVNPYLFLLSLSSLRQTLALCIFICALNLKIDNNKIKLIVYIGMMIISSYIHQTSILLLPFFFIYNAKKNIKLDRIVFLAIPFILLFSEGLLMNLIDRALAILNNNLNYVNYLASSDGSSLRSTLLFFIFYLYVLLNLEKLDEKRYKIAKLYLFGLLFAILSFKYSMFGRFQMYFDIFGIVTIPSIIYATRYNSRNKVDFYLNSYIIPVILICIFFFRYYSFFITPLWSYFFEYHTFLF